LNLNGSKSGWGGEKIIENRDEYCAKILYIFKNKKMSIHKHIEKLETFHILVGKIELRYGDNVERIEATKGSGMWSIILEAGETFHIPRNRVHQVIALMDSQILEVSTHDQPEDSIRIVKGD